MGPHLVAGDEVDAGFMGMVLHDVQHMAEKRGGQIGIFRRRGVAEEVEAGGVQVQDGVQHIAVPQDGVIPRIVLPLELEVFPGVPRTIISWKMSSASSYLSA